MKITRIKGHAISKPLGTTLYMGNQIVTACSQIIVEVETDEGITGIATIHGRSIPQVLKALEEMESLIAGMDAMAHEAVWKKIFDLTSMPAEACYKLGKPALFGSPNRTPILTALAGVDIALWDIKGKAQNMPLWRLLGGTRRDVFAYVSGGYYEEGRDPLYIADEMGTFIAEGFTAAKIKVGGVALALDVQRVKAVRDAIGPDTLLMLDGNYAYSLEEATDAIRAFEPYNIHWFEEPIHWYDTVRGLGRLAQRTNVSLAAGDSDLHSWACRDLVDFGGIRYMEFDPTRACGITEWLRVAAYSHLHGVLMATHHDPHINGHLAASAPNGYCCETFPRSKRDPFWDILFTHRAQLDKGRLIMGDEPGLGFGIDWKVVEKYRV